MKKQILILISSLVILSCGARKVNKSDTEETTKEKSKEVVSNDVVKTENTKIETKTKTDESTKETIKETTYKPIDNKKPALFTDSKGQKKELYNTEYTEREITRNKESKFEGNTNTLVNTKTSDKTKKTSEKEKDNKKKEKTKEVDKKQFDPVSVLISYWWFFLLLIIVYYLYRKYKNKFLIP
jgi:hypothetical protein